MRLGARIFFSFMLILALFLYYPMNFAVDTLRTRYLEGVEDALVDQANILAALAALEFTSQSNSAHAGDPNPPDLTDWQTALAKAHGRDPEAQIYNLAKASVDMQVYITDAAGRLLYDSAQPGRVGNDFSSWRDVHLTLEGRYGARTTQSDPEDPLSSVLHVAAPIRVNGTLAGVLTVAKPTTNINNFLKEAKPHIIRVGILSGLVAALAGLLSTYWWIRPINRLTRYAQAVSHDRRVPFPRLDRTEIGAMGRAFEQMQIALEGKQYVEQYVQNLTHELKSPLSAIHGAAELLGEKRMSGEQRQRFLANIQRETGRIRQIVDRMLALAALENRQTLTKKAPVRLAALVNTVLEGLQPRIIHQKLDLQTDIPDDVRLEGDELLLHQALANLIQNAMDFSPEGGRIVLKAEIRDGQLALEVLDEGSGIPDYAQTKIFDKFYSLRRPAGGAKSTGLGLNFVREIAALHGGTIQITNRPPRGVRACLKLPLGQ